MNPCVPFLFQCLLALLALLAVRPVFTAVLAFLSQPLLIIIILYETNYTASMSQGKLWQVGCEVQIGN